MKVGIPKEIKNNENRVGMTPSGVAELVNRGHQVLVQHTAGEGSGFSDAEYQKVGATIVPTIEDVYAQADMIVKVKVTYLFATTGFEQKYFRNVFWGKKVQADPVEGS